MSEAEIITSISDWNDGEYTLFAFCWSYSVSTHFEIANTRFCTGWFTMFARMRRSVIVM